MNKEKHIQNTDKESIAIKVPYYLTSLQSVSKVITPTVQKQIQDDHDHISIGDQGFVTLSKKKLNRSIYLTNIKKYKHKETGEIVEKIQKSVCIGKGYDYLRMTDFSISNQEARKPQNELEALKNHLSQKLIQQKSVEEVKFNILPNFFLKPFNLAPSNNDMLVNRIKSQSNKGLINSKNIFYGQQIPQRPPSQIPEYVTSSKIYPVVKTYFEKRPCWLRNVIQYTLYQDGYKGQFTINELKNVLKFLSYTFRDGPWKHTFCRLGYNPLQKIESVIFQILLIKIKKKEVEDYDEKSEEIEQIVYDPTFKELPKKFLRLYQLCDISDKRIQQLLTAISNSTGQCSKQYGWFNKRQYSDLLKLSRNIRDQLNDVN